MKILYIPTRSEYIIDYLSDEIFIGLVNNGHEVTDSEHTWWVEDCTMELKKMMWGLGFGITGNLSNRKDIDRDFIEDKISEHYFDCVIYGSIWRNDSYYDLVKEHYEYDEIVLLDGEDCIADLRCNYDKGLYFKREFSFNEGILPIEFSIPEKFIHTPVFHDDKCYDFLPLKNITNSEKNYKFDNEKDYYDFLSKHHFCETEIKAGFDAMRHYEIIASYSLPVFQNIKYLPRFTMFKYPVDLQMECNRMYWEGYSYKHYDHILENMVHHLKENLTSEKMADYIISYIN